MPDPHALAFLRIPTGILVALDYRPFHFALQPYHYVIRLLHVLFMAAFFGGIALLDFRLVGLRRMGPLRALAAQVQSWLYVTFAAATVTGVALFLYDPVHVGSHAYFTPKLILIALGLGNAVLFHVTGYGPALAADDSTSTGARIAGAVSLLVWTGVVVCACLNVEAAPKLLLR